MFRRVSDCRDYPGCRDGNGGTQQQSGGERRGTEPCTAQEIDRIKDMGDCEKRSLQQKHAAFSAIVAGGGHQQAERHERTVPFCRDERNDGKIKHGKGEDQRQQRQAEMLPHAVHCDRNGISRHNDMYVPFFIASPPSDLSEPLAAPPLPDSVPSGKSRFRQTVLQQRPAENGSETEQFQKPLRRPQRPASNRIDEYKHDRSRIYQVARLVVYLVLEPQFHARPLRNPYTNRQQSIGQAPG